MKKVNLLLLLSMLSFGVFFTSCSKDDPNAPTVSFKEGSTADGATIDVGAVATYEVVVEADEDDELKSVQVIVENVTVLDTTASGGSFTFTYEYAGTMAKTGILITFKAVAKDGGEGSANRTLNVKEATTALSAETDATWERDGGAAATGLSMFGLEWTKNTSTGAKIVPMTGTTLVQLADDAWSTISTQEGLMDAVDNATALTIYEGVAVDAAKTDYTDVIATKYNGVYYMIKIVSSSLGKNSTGGTIVTVQVKYMK